jgi:hypothetical protein
MNSDQKPIGYWLKHVDRLIDDGFERALADQGLMRRHWQVMNVLHTGPADDDAIADAVQPFWVQGAVTLGEVLGELVARGWTERGNGAQYRLSQRGEAAHAAVAGRVQAIRELSMRDITAEEYAAAVNTLRRIAENLESAAQTDGAG